MADSNRNLKKGRFIDVTSRLNEGQLQDESRKGGEGRRQGHGKVGSATNTNQPFESDTLSGSVNLDDIIDYFDDDSSKSKSDSFASLLNSIKQHSQSYFTARGTTSKDNESTNTFYSALQDAFSLSDFNAINNVSEHPNIRQEGYFWPTGDQSEREAMLPLTDFEIYWHDLVYTINPKVTIKSFFDGLRSRFAISLHNFYSFMLHSKSKTYDINSISSISNHVSTKILQGICGSFRSSQMTAVIGPSGAGKTSLLNFVSRRREEGYSGRLYVKDSHRKIHVNSIPQNDILAEYLTVRENLRFASRLKNPSLNYDHETRVIEFSKLLGLDDCLDTRTGKISGGQQKRLAIAQELMSKPDILILDEPTSGLDSATCYKTLSVLRNLVKASEKKSIDPIAILLTIHQPEQEVFDLFDKIYGLASGGRVIYDGPPEDCTRFIEQHTGLKMPGECYNPASFLIEVASGEFGERPIELLEAQVKLQFNRKEALLGGQAGRLADQTVDTIEEADSDHIHTSNSDEKCADVSGKKVRQIDPRIARASSNNHGSFWRKTWILSERCWLLIMKDPKQSVARLAFHLSFPLFLALIVGSEAGRANACPRYSTNYTMADIMEDGKLSNHTSRTNADISNEEIQQELMLSLENSGIIFMIIYGLTASSLGITTLSFTLDCQRCLKESYNGWYSMTSYLIARLVTDTPMDIIFPSITIALGFPLTGQITDSGMPSALRMTLTAMSIILGSMIGRCIGMIVGALYIGHVSTALFVSQAITLPLVFLSGFVTRFKDMSRAVYALSYISFYRYALVISSVARYGYGVCECDPKIFDGNEPQIVGVSEDLKKFTKHWMTSYADDDVIKNSTKSDDPEDMFQLFAKQISLYRTYGMKVKSCEDVVPFHLQDLELREQDVPYYFLALVVSLLITKLMLVLVVKLVFRLKAGL